jgi:cytochrome oxidase Cu insertion factor (SCO1/SenC/PrrC family)
MRRSRLVLPLLSLAAALAVFLVVGCPRPKDTPPTTPVQPDLDWPVGSFSLTERSGKTVTDADLKGKVWVAAFVFTRCAEPCPRVSATMRQLQNELPPSDDLRLVTFTVDPEYDTPAVLKQYAANFTADPDRWLFLTGPEKDVHELLNKRFKQAVERNPNPAADPGERIFHSSRLAVVDRKGVIRVVYDGAASKNQPDADERFAENLARLKAKVGQLLEE